MILPRNFEQQHLIFHHSSNTSFLESFRRTHSRKKWQRAFDTCKHGAKWHPPSWYLARGLRAVRDWRPSSKRNVVEYVCRRGSFLFFRFCFLCPCMLCCIDTLVDTATVKGRDLKDGERTLNKVSFGKRTADIYVGSSLVIHLILKWLFSFLKVLFLVVSFENPICLKCYIFCSSSYLSIGKRAYWSPGRRIKC